MKKWECRTSAYDNGIWVQQTKCQRRCITLLLEYREAARVAVETLRNVKLRNDVAGLLDREDIDKSIEILSEIGIDKH